MHRSGDGPAARFQFVGRGGITAVFQRDIAGGRFGLALFTEIPVVPVTRVHQHVATGGPIWPIYAEDLSPLKELVSPSPTHPYYVRQRRPNGFRVLALFPQLPAEFVPLLWAAALGEDREVGRSGLPEQCRKHTISNTAILRGRSPCLGQEQVGPSLATARRESRTKDSSRWHTSTRTRTRPIRGAF